LKTVGIVGGGAAGALVAVNLLKAIGVGDEVIVFEPSMEIGRGVPYGTLDPLHLLNVRAGGMSALVDQPSHFAEWYSRQSGLSTSEATTAFAPRRDYGRYIGELLAETAENTRGCLTIIQERVASVESGTRLALKTSGGAQVLIDQLVLATGHMTPETPDTLKAVEHDTRYIANPWSPDSLSRVQPDDSVFILGTGLTMVDVVISLASRGHRGSIVARSRRGLVPMSHKLAPPAPFKIEDVDPNAVIKSVTRLLREAGADWRTVMDGMRPLTQQIWEMLSWEDRGRFVRKLRPFWDVHRHRIPESAHAVIEGLVELGRLDIGKGAVNSIDWVGDKLCVAVGDARISTDWIVNCTGPNLHLSQAKIPILESLVNNSLASYDPLGLGILVNSKGQTQPNGHIWALGPLCRGSRWETTAIPEIRHQAATISTEILYG